MVEHGGSSASSYLADPTSPIPSYCASIVVTSTLRVKSAPEITHSSSMLRTCIQWDMYFVRVTEQWQLNSTH